MNKKSIWLLIWLTTAMLVGCQETSKLSVTRNEKGRITSPQERKHDVPPQVIYRIDDYRFVTLESYDQCSGETWYNDVKSGVKTLVGHTWPNGFQGRLIIDDSTGRNVVIPKVSTNLCGDRGCMNYMAYSTDGGRTFEWMRYDIHEHTPDSVESSRNYTFSVTGDAVYVTYSGGRAGPVTTDKFPLVQGFSYGKGSKLPEGNKVQYGTTLPANLRTPSGQERYVCDSTIRPSDAGKTP